MSVMSPEVMADFETQFSNLLRQVKTLQQMANISVGTVIPTTTPGTGNNTPVPPPVPTTGGSGQIDPITGQPLPNAPPIILQQGVAPVTDLNIKPGAYLNQVYADVFWEVQPNSNALFFMVQWGTVNLDGTLTLAGTAQCGGNTYRILNLNPNTFYGVQILAVNALGQSIATPTNGFLVFETTQDATVPPPVSSNGGRVLVGQGATSVIVTFQPLTIEQAPDVANGAGVYLVQISNDPAFGTVFRQMYSSAWVVAFNDVYPNTTLQSAIAAGDGPGTTETFADLSSVTPGSQFTALIDSEYIVFNAPTGNTATIAQRNAGTTPLANGPTAHGIGAKTTFSTQTTWYARVAPIDSSNNQGPWTNSSGAFAGGVTDSMLVGDLNAAHIAFGVMQGDRIEVNSLSAASIKTSSLTAANITLNGGSFIAGNPPTTGMVVNSQGLTLYNGGVQTVNLNAVTGSATFSGNVSGASVSGGTISGTTISGTTISGSTITGTTLTIGSPTVLSIGSGGMTIFDSSNRTRIVLGSLSSGDYGIEVYDPSGNGLEILPTASAFAAGSFSSASSTAAVPGGAPSCTAWLGASGNALLSISGWIQPPAGGQGTIYLVIDGSIVNFAFATSTGNTTAAATVNLIAFLNAVPHSLPSASASHTFTIALSNISGTCFFNNISISIQPI